MFGHPLMQFHTMLRATAGAGYPNMSFYNPHPLEMSAYGLNRPKRPPSRYQMGRMPIQVPMQQPFSPVNTRRRPMQSVPTAGYKITR